MSEVASPITYKLQIKRAVVKAFKSVFESDYPDQWGILQSIFISYEWPDAPEQFPHIMVGYKENQIQNIGVGNFHYLTPNAVVERFMYQGTVQIMIGALTSLQRDYISDHVIHLLSFPKTSIWTATFIQIMDQNPGVDIIPGGDVIQPAGEHVEEGSDWGYTDQRFYFTGYSFNVIGTYTSGIVNHPYIQGVREAYEIEN